MNTNNLHLLSITNKYISAIIAIVLTIIAYEVIYLWPHASNEVIRLTLGFALVFTVIYVAVRYGLKPGVLVAIISNAYLLYAFSGPGRDIVPLQNMLRGEWLIFMLFFLPAIIIGYLRDKIDILITREKIARQRAEQGEKRLAQILEQMPVGVAIANATQEQIVFSNQHLDRLIGLKMDQIDVSHHQVSGKFLDADGQTIPKDNWPLFRVLNQHEHIQSEEYIYEGPSSKTYLKVRGVPIYDDKQNIESGVLIVDDITKEKEIDQKKDDFISMISHELKTPLTSLKIYTQLLLKQDAPTNYKSIKNSLDKINDQADKLQRLVDGMLYVAQTQADKLQYKFETVELSDVMANIIAELRVIIIDHTIEYHDNDKATVAVDVDRLSQVIINLATNAAKYSSPGTKIDIELTTSDDSAIISVRDYGVGISSSDQNRVFNRFYQSTRVNGRSHGGLGIGLYLAADIISRHDGKIWVESQLNQGSTFFVSLPLQVKK